ncbi:MAG: mRNA-degrading endonuclease [Omnitrophica bacterium RIFCSPHIGHO2_02_FULL_51_18]|nr:MAG: mRNA-degrading endonuclease [Omnitrophica bacterium RIFCSPHIGHO2_02_FULL_51_18]
MQGSHCPDRGDIVWIDFSPQAGHEQAGARPALTLSPEGYNRKLGLMICCPITSQAKGYPFEVTLPEGLKVRGVVLSDQARSMDWHARRAQFCCKAPLQVVSEVLAKLNTLLN